MEIVLNTFGTSLSRENDGFVVKNDGNKRRLPPDGVRSILVGKGVSITSDAIMLAVDNEIEIHFVDRAGNIKGLLWSHKYGSISTIRKSQLLFVQSSAAVKWIIGIIRRKIENQQALLLMIDAKDDKGKRSIETAMTRLSRYIERLTQLSGETVRDVAHELRGIEGSAARQYFGAMSDTLPLQYRFHERSQHPARDVANALLNYGYGVLYTRVEISLIKAGIDPYVGVLHRDEYNRPVLVFDMIEMYRVWVDYVVMQLLMQEVVDDCYYSLTEDGACWLESLGRRVIIQSLNDYLDEVVNQSDGERHSRVSQIQRDAYSLANTIKTLTK